MSAPDGAPPQAGIRPHSRFYFNDGNVLLVVQGFLYCIHVSRVATVCPVLAQLLEQPDETMPRGWESRPLRTNEEIYVHWANREITDTRPSVWDNDGALILYDVTGRELDAFLSILYPDNMITYDLHTPEDWQAVLRLAERWSCRPIIQLALHQLHTSSGHSLVERLALAYRHNVEDWIRPALRALCLRPHSLTADEIRRLGPYPEALAFIMSTREDARSGNGPAVDRALDTWESAPTAIPEPDAEEAAFSPALPQPPHIPSSLGVSTAIPSSPTIPPVSDLNVPIATTTTDPVSAAIDELTPDAAALHSEDLPAFREDEAGNLVAPSSLNFNTSIEAGSASDVVQAGASTISHDHPVSQSANLGSGEAPGPAGLINFDTPAMQSGGATDEHGSATTVPGGQLAEDVALSPIDDRFDGSAMQSRTSSPHDDEDFDPARPSTRSPSSNAGSPESTREEKQRYPVGFGVWRGEGPTAAWSAESSTSDEPRVPGAHKDDSITRTTSSGSAVTASPMKSVLNFFASTAAGILGSGGNAEAPRRARADSAPEGGQQDKGKGRQTESEAAATVVAASAPSTAAPATLWHPSQDPQTSRAPRNYQDQELSETNQADGGGDEESKDAEVDEREVGDDEGGGGGKGDSSGRASMGQQSLATIIDPYQGMSESQRKKARQKANAKAKKEAEQAMKDERRKHGRR
ncbi:unnamed protein product [Peniophora sp. CBMAI 1063]|nr:unnamed protein product [Peniophora sp. CBMAI 1063]